MKEINCSDLAIELGESELLARQRGRAHVRKGAKRIHREGDDECPTPWKPRALELVNSHVIY